MSGTLGLILDVTIIVLLATTIAFAAVLSRRLAAWRRDKTEFERLIAAFNQAAERAEAGVARLKAGSEETGKLLHQGVTKGQSLRDDLAYLIERAEPLADRLTDAVRAARGASARAELAQPPASRPEPKEDRPVDEAAERERAKRDLMRALAALR